MLVRSHCPTQNVLSSWDHTTLSTWINDQSPLLPTILQDSPPPSYLIRMEKGLTLLLKYAQGTVRSAQRKSMKRVLIHSNPPTETNSTSINIKEYPCAIWSGTQKKLFRDSFVGWIGSDRHLRELYNYFQSTLH